ncbi:MAG: SDR family oxidoreductase [Anaerolineales bacterium]|jgi:NAD(P)-dependent dehydrogenase (short-subunit alcohol dehydrogenase family)
MNNANLETQANRMEGKLCLVTGASRGIGFHTALGLASMGAHVILASHHRERGESARQRINTSVGKNATDFILVDLSSQGGIREFTDTIKERYNHLDVLVNNAGGFFLRREGSEDGIEMTFALNHLNYFMTTLLLMDLILSAEASRIVNVSSGSHRGAEMHFDDLQFENGYNAMEAYGQSKLANLLFTYELSRRLANTNVTVNALHPGFVNTHFAKQNGPVVRALMNLVHFLFARSPEKGAETPIYLASSPEVEGVTGKYFIDKEPVRSSQASYDGEAAQRLWDISERMCHLDVSNLNISELEVQTEQYEHAYHY